jgi:hypothetical protein
MHQNKPTAPIIYLNDKGDKVSVDEDNGIENPLNLTLKELAILQTCLYRSYLNCNCNLNKEVLGNILAKAKANLRTYGK